MQYAEKKGVFCQESGFVFPNMGFIGLEMTLTEYEVFLFTAQVDEIQ